MTFLSSDSSSSLTSLLPFTLWITLSTCTASPLTLTFKILSYVQALSLPKVPLYLHKWLLLQPPPTPPSCVLFLKARSSPLLTCTCSLLVISSADMGPISTWMWMTYKSNLLLYWRILRFRICVLVKKNDTTHARCLQGQNENRAKFPSVCLACEECCTTTWITQHRNRHNLQHSGDPSNILPGIASL